MSGSALSHIRVSDGMHHGMLSCAPDDPLRAVAAIMTSHRVHAVLVAERRGGRPLGVISTLDVLSLLCRDRDA